MSATVFLQHLLVASDRYAMEKLKATCEYELVESISLDTALTIVTDSSFVTILLRACVLATRKLAAALRDRYVDI
ncbi:BTB/POZ and MATH domain-containing protein 1-like isoform X1 [Carex littledalei]|uniref:BTB/POZ and MATH domain-containing protein 1-like isoform X1 n=1 Tax=Carex littledalei TaxID=544730 RepID=A0A833RAI9_9POAL|nr:BTB/POZ and MATH domain-containing protein 1-like isoform X1 [Carex littledalei]